MNKSVPIPDPLHALRQALQEAGAAPADAPRGMPGPFYTDPAYYGHEACTVLHRGWHCVGREDELSEHGAFMTVTLLGEPLIIVRDGDQIHALANVCQHRGMPLVQGSGQATRFVCRYHAWTYGADGALLRAPRMKNAGFEPENCRLGRFHCARRFGFIYVCLAEEAPDLDAAIEGLSELIAPYEPEAFRTVHAASEIWRCNWKCLVENFMEGYHLSVVHPETLHGYTPTGLSRKGPAGAGFTSYLANYPKDIEPRGKGSPGLSDTERHRSTLFSVFPGQVVSISASLLVSLSIRPLDAESIDVRWSLSVFADDLDKEAIRQRIHLWDEVNREDREKLEAMQPALHSVHARGGPLAGEDYEGTIRDFIGWLARQDAAV